MTKNDRTTPSSHPHSISSHLLESQLHSTIESLTLQIPSPSQSSCNEYPDAPIWSEDSTASTQAEHSEQLVSQLRAKVQNYHFQGDTGEQVESMFQSVAQKLMSTENAAVPSSRSRPHPHHSSFRNITQFPRSAHKQFLKEMTQKNLPFVVRKYQSLMHCEKLKRALLDDHMNDELTVSVTPNGRADALFRDLHQQPSPSNDSTPSTDNTQTSGPHKYFMFPHETKLTMKTFLEKLKDQHHYVSRNPANSEHQLLSYNKDTHHFHTPSNFYYIQTQNDNLRTDFPHLLSLVDEDFQLGEFCFEDAPEAINLWMGTSGTVSSLHRDYYENFYLVVDGVKEFILYPPFMQPYLYEESFETAQWKEVGPNEWIIEARNEENVWCAVNPERDPSEQQSEYPWFRRAQAYKVRVGPGDLLYLPSAWFHQVSQYSLQKDSSKGHVIAVNYWFPMQFGSLYHYNDMIENLGHMARHGVAKQDATEDEY